MNLHVLMAEVSLHSVINITKCWSITVTISACLLLREIMTELARFGYTSYILVDGQLYRFDSHLVTLITGFETRSCW
jgi:hypothetical protein